MPGKVVSKSQAALLGAIAANIPSARRKAPGLSPSQARELLRGENVKDLPEFSNSPIGMALLRMFEGEEPVSLEERIGPEGETTSPGLILGADKFPVLDGADIGDEVALLIRGRAHRVTRIEDHPTQVGLNLLEAVMVQIAPQAETNSRRRG